MNDERFEKIAEVVREALWVDADTELIVERATQCILDIVDDIVDDSVDDKTRSEPPSRRLE